jgi:hypothetical protein
MVGATSDTRSATAPVGGRLTTERLTAVSLYIGPQLEDRHPEPKV